MFPTTATIRAAKRDRVAGGQQQLPTGKVVPDCYTTYNEKTTDLTLILLVHTPFVEIFLFIAKPLDGGILLLSKLGHNFTCMPVGDSFHFVCRFCGFRIFDQLIINLQWVTGPEMDF
jgi:hypothetical protein